MDADTAILDSDTRVCRDARQIHVGRMSDTVLRPDIIPVGGTAKSGQTANQTANQTENMIRQYTLPYACHNACDRLELGGSY